MHIGPNDPSLSLSGSRPRALIVDDNRINCMVAGNYCETFGCEVVIATDGDEAFELCQTSNFDLILMDIRMPRMNGIEASEQIRSLAGRFASVPIIAVTGDGELNGRDLRDCAFQAVLVKPISMHALSAAIRAALTSMTEARVTSDAKAA